MTTTSLFQTALDHHRNGRLAEAEACYRRLLADEPHNANALHLLGLACHQRGHHADAAELIGKAVELAPANPDFLNNYGAALRAGGQTEKAAACYRQALKIAPRDLDLQNNLGNACLELRRFDEAAACYRNLLKVLPGNQDVRAALLHALQAGGFEQHAQGRFAAAEAAYAEAIALNPADGALYYNLGNAQRELGKPEAALKSYRQALSLLPDDADVHNNLGNVLRETGQLQEAIAAYRTALALNPALHHARVHLVHQMQHACDWAGLDDEIGRIRQWVKTVPQAQVSPFAFLAMPGTTAAEQKQCASHWVENRIAPLLPQRLPADFSRNLQHKKLRVGYLSSDFRLHPLAFLITELIELHDRKQFEIVAYSAAQDDKTPERKRLEKAFDRFVDIRSLSTTDAARRIRQDEIDILVDLTGFTHTSRSAVAALRPAPVCINWLGFPGTMGHLPASGGQPARPLFDYLLTDDFITPSSAAVDYAEMLLPLPLCYQPNDRKRPVGKPVSRASQGLPDDAFVFCCFNQTFKILPAMFDIWMRLLQARPGSVLWLLECNPLARANLQREAEKRGIDAKRLVFAARVPIAQHLARHALADLFLDTLPYNAHTTASDALWMGLPLLTCAGDTFAGRVAGSLLHAIGMTELITGTLPDYEQKALTLSANKAEIDRIKQQLAGFRDTAPLFDTARFGRDLEQRYLQVWQRFVEQTGTC